MAGKTKRTTLYTSRNSSFEISGLPGKIIKFHKTRSPYFRNIMDIYAMAFAANDSPITAYDHAIFCARCGASGSIEAVAKGFDLGWEFIPSAGNYRDGQWVCLACRRNHAPNEREYIK